MVSKNNKNQKSAVSKDAGSTSTAVLVGQTTRRKLMNFPGRSGAPKAHRAGTKRALVVEMLTRPEGATFKQVQAAVEDRFGKEGAWDDKTCTEGIKLISIALGYALTEDPQTGIIRARAVA
jgi:hypothetical protein